MPFSAVQRVLVAKYYFRKQWFEAVKQVNFPDSAIPNKPTIFRLVNRQSFYEYAKTD
jgi:hypothetical protein